MNKEMENLKTTFDVLEDRAKILVGCDKESGHLLFDVRMPLEWKYRWVKDGCRTPEPEQSAFSGVASRKSARIALARAVLNDLPTCACGIENACLQDPSSEKHYVVCGPEFAQENTGKHATIVRTLCGGKSAGAYYWRHARSDREEIGFSSCKVDPDAWILPVLKSNGPTSTRI